MSIHIRNKKVRKQFYFDMNIDLIGMCFLHRSIYPCRSTLLFLFERNAFVNEKRYMLLPTLHSVRKALRL